MEAVIGAFSDGEFIYFDFNRVDLALLESPRIFV